MVNVGATPVALIGQTGLGSGALKPDRAARVDRHLSHYERKVTHCEKVWNAREISLSMYVNGT
jgi:hypothetical protein